jgi:hypothetical protein
MTSFYGGDDADPVMLCALQVSCAPMNGLVFASYRGLMRLQLPHKDAVPTLTQVFLAGAGTGVIGW